MAEVTFEFDIDTLTVEEIEILEDVTGLSLGDIIGHDQAGKPVMKPGVKVGKLLRAIAYIEGRRSDPDYTLEQAGKVPLNAKRPTRAGAGQKAVSLASSASSGSRKPRASKSKTSSA